MLMNRPIIRSMSGAYHLPSQTFILPPEYRDGTAALVPEHFLTLGLHYLSDDYDFVNSTASLRSPGH